MSEDLAQGSSWRSPVIVLEPGPPVGSSQECLHSTGQVHKQVTHQKEPASQGLVGTEEPPWQPGTGCPCPAWAQPRLPSLTATTSKPKADVSTAQVSSELGLRGWASVYRQSKVGRGQQAGGTAVKKGGAEECSGSGDGRQHSGSWPGNQLD